MLLLQVSSVNLADTFGGQIHSFLIKEEIVLTKKYSCLLFHRNSTDGRNNWVLTNIFQYLSCSLIGSLKTQNLFRTNFR